MEVTLLQARQSKFDTTLAGPGSDTSTLAPLQVAYDKYEVIRLYSPEDPNGRGPVTLIRDRDVVMVVQNPERWFGELFIRSGKSDPRTQMSIHAPRFEDARRKRAEAANLPEGEEQDRALAESAALEKYWRDFFWTADVKRWLEQSCFLVVDGQRLTDLHPIVEGSFGRVKWSADATQYHQIWYLRFHLKVTEANKPIWMDLLSGQGLKARPVTVTLGQSNVVNENTYEMPTSLSPHAKEHTAYLQVACPLRMTGGLFVVGLLLVAFLLLATKITSLQNFGTDALWHMSLGRTQMAFWFLVILMSYVFLWIVTGDYNTLTHSELVLLGISATTGLGAILISESVKAGAPHPYEVLSMTEISLTHAMDFQPLILEAEHDLAAHQKSVDMAQDATQKVELLKELQRLERRLAELKKRQAYFQLGGWHWLKRVALELVQEVDSPSLHRFQMIAWTLVLGLVFLSSVYLTLTMPKLDAALLALMGISSGSYLGFKLSH